MQNVLNSAESKMKKKCDVEIICFSDNPDEFYTEEGFLGFDAYWVEEAISGLADGCEVTDYFQDKLNVNGLFSSYEDAQKFCDEWKKDIDANDPSPWVIETKPRPFCVWAFQRHI